MRTRGYFFSAVIKLKKLLKWQHSYLATADKSKKPDDRRKETDIILMLNE